MTPSTWSPIEYFETNPMNVTRSFSGSGSLRRVPSRPVSFTPSSVFPDAPPRGCSARRGESLAVDGASPSPRSSPVGAAPVFLVFLSAFFLAGGGFDFVGFVQARSRCSYEIGWPSTSSCPSWCPSTCWCGSRFPAPPGGWPGHEPGCARRTPSRLRRSASHRSDDPPRTTSRGRRGTLGRSRWRRRSRRPSRHLEDERIAAPDRSRRWCDDLASEHGSLELAELGVVDPVGERGVDDHGHGVVGVLRGDRLPRPHRAGRGSVVSGPPSRCSTRRRRDVGR